VRRAQERREAGLQPTPDSEKKKKREEGIDPQHSGETFESFYRETSSREKKGRRSRRRSGARLGKYDLGRGENPHLPKIGLGKKGSSSKVQPFTGKAKENSATGNLGRPDYVPTEIETRRQCPALKKGPASTEYAGGAGQAYRLRQSTPTSTRRKREETSELDPSDALEGGGIPERLSPMWWVSARAGPARGGTRNPPARRSTTSSEQQRGGEALKANLSKA